jgi:porin
VKIRSWLPRSVAAASALLASPAVADDPDPPLDLGGSYLADGFANVAGGARRGYRQMGLLQLSAEVNGGVLGAKDVKGFASVQFVHGQSLSGDLVGDAQIVSNIDAPDGLRLFEAWVSIPVTHHTYVKAGLIDLNGEFDVQSVGTLFLNSSHGIGPDFSQSGLNGPSIFPTTATAVVGGWDGDGWTARIGLFDAVAGDPDDVRRTVIRFPGSTGLLLVAEADFAIAGDAELQVGAWRFSSRFETIGTDVRDGPREDRGNQGAYAMVEGQLGKLHDRPISAWLRVGIAETEFNPIGFYVGGGAVAGAESSRWGLAVGYARLGRTALRGAGPGRKRAETSVELTYARTIGPRLTIQPDVQFVINPGWDARLRSALLAGVRLQVELF